MVMVRVRVIMNPNRRIREDEKDSLSVYLLRSGLISSENIYWSLYIVLKGGLMKVSK